jgi:predicted ATPase/DNA-binding SARP family transcriptional activator
VLAILLVHANRVVSVEQLCDELWEGRAPATARAALQVHVATLRRSLGIAAQLETRAPGYVLEVDADQLDAHRFERHVERAREALSVHEPSRASEEIRAGLALWRGPALSEFVDLPCARREAARLEDVRLGALEDRVDIELAGGRPTEVVPELRDLTARYPYRERLYAQLMTALYRSGCQAEALTVYRDARAVLVDELGIEPGPALRALQQAILAQDPALQAEGTTSSPDVAGSADGGTLPPPANATIGREGDLQQLAALLAESDVRLVTLWGPGGVGKTRLVLEAARVAAGSGAGSAYFADLSPVRDHADVPAAVASVLGCVPVGAETYEQAVCRFLRPKAALLVLDNLEHVLEQAAFVARVLGACSRLRILATSREPLKLQSEHRYAVRPLATADAEALFNDRARRVIGGAELDQRAVTDICARLDGLPLTLELAAARLALLPPGELVQRLDDALGVLGMGPRDAPARQRTLRATVDWSVRLLASEERDAFAALAVFAGGATVDAAERITRAPLDVLEALIDKSLVVRRGDRLVMLETIRQYAAELLLRRPDAEELHRRHLQLLVELAEAADAALGGPDERFWLARVDSEQDNVRAILRWALEIADYEGATRLASALAGYWRIRGYGREGLPWLQAALAGAGERLSLPLAARASLGIASMRGSLEDYDGAYQDATRAEALLRESGDQRELALALITRSQVRLAVGSLDDAAAAGHEALDIAGALSDDALSAAALAALVPVVGPIERQEFAESALDHFRRLGDLRGQAELLSRMSYTAMLERDAAGALRLSQAAHVAACALGEPQVLAFVRGNQGLAALFSGDLDGAMEAFREELSIARQQVLQLLAAEAIVGLAAVAALDGDLERAARLCGAADRYEEVAQPLTARARDQLIAPAREGWATGEWERAYAVGRREELDEAIATALAS